MASQHVTRLRAAIDGFLRGENPGFVGFVQGYGRGFIERANEEIFDYGAIVAKVHYGKSVMEALC